MVRTRFSGGRKAPLKRFAKGCAGAIAVLLASTTATTQAAPMPLIPAPAMVRATPALWEIRDADTTIYLFGTFHTLDGRTAWFDNRVRKAFDASGELVLETVIPTDMSGAQAQVTEISPGGERKLKPFIAQTQAVMSASNAIGMSVDNGADMVLRRVAEGNGKRVSGLERFEDQLKTLSNIPTTPPPASAAAADPAAAPPVAVTINDLLGAWTRGDTGAFSTMLAGFEAKSPIAYRMLIADRNERWGQWIINRLDQPGTVFVAVGTGHLAGRHSVQSWLADHGIATNRVS